MVTDWPRGYLPTAEMLANLLRLEQARDVSVIDLEECDRRDVGTHAIIATGVTARHCRRLGHIMFRATEARCFDAKASCTVTVSQVDSSNSVSEQTDSQHVHLGRSPF